MGISRRNAAGVVLSRTAMCPLESGLERVFAFYPTHRIGKLHQGTWVEPRRRSGPVERCIVAQLNASSRHSASNSAGLRIEQLVLELYEGGQSFFGRRGDIRFGSTPNAAAHIEWRPTKPTIAF